MEETSKHELENLIDELSEQLANDFYQTINVLSSIVQFTEKYYEGSHSRFVSEKSALIAKELGFSDEDVMEVKIAGLLHDIGKLAFSDTMLYKNQNEMNDAERAKYRLYPELGMQLLKPNSNFDNIGRIILQHRERLDGTGFPRNIKKDNIHPASKIIIVVDYYHTHVYKRLRNRASFENPANSITSSKAYNDLTNERYISTMNYLNKKKNIFFEKKVVEIFQNLIELERVSMGSRSIVRITVNEIMHGMVFAEDYYTPYGMLIAAKGETATNEMKRALIRFAENGDLPHKILVIK